MCNEQDVKNCGGRGGKEGGGGGGLLFRTSIVALNECEGIIGTIVSTRCEIFDT